VALKLLNEGKLTKVASYLNSCSKVESLHLHARVSKKMKKASQELFSWSRTIHAMH
jgi:hypothetical protein